MSEFSEGGASGTANRPAGRDQVIEATIVAATRLFSQRNPSQVSVREIAAAAGVSHALVHRYMGSKEEIFAAALARSRADAADYWVKDHGMSQTAGTFESDLPPGRYVRTIVRAALDGVEIHPEDVKFPHADAMVDMLKATKLPDEDPSRGFDVRFLFSAAIAMAAGMAVAEDFFLVQSGLENADHEVIYAELNRLIRRLFTLADANESLGA